MSELAAALEVKASTVGSPERRLAFIGRLAKILWLAAFAWVFYQLYASEEFTAAGGEPVAFLADSHGHVQYRPARYSLWIDSTKSQSLHDGDVIATDDDAWARIAVVGGSTIEVKGNSEVVISRGGKGNIDSIVTLLSGQLRMAANGKQHLRVSSGTKAFEVIGAGASLRLARSREAAAPKVLESVGHVMPVPRDTALDGEAPPLPLAASSPRPLPLSSPPALAAETARPLPQSPPTSAAGFESRLKAPLTRSLWSIDPLNSASAPIYVPIELPNATSLPAGWHPVIGVRSTASGPESVLVGGPAPRGARLQVPIPSKLARTHLLFLRAGAQIGSEPASFAGGGAEYRLQSLADYAKAPARLEMGSFSPSMVRVAGWLEQTPETLASPAPATLVVRFGTDLAKLAPTMAGAHGSFRVAASRWSVDEKGIFYVRKGAVVAKLTGTAFTPTKIKALTAILDADFAFQGDGKSYRSFPATKTERNALIADLIKSKSKIFLLVAGNLVPLDKTLLEREHATAAYIASAAMAIFTARPTIVLVRQ